MGVLFPFLVLLSLGKLLPVVGFDPNRGTEPQKRWLTTEGTNTAVSSQFSAGGRKLLQNFQGLLEGGNLAERRRFPWMGLLVDRQDAQACGGVLIHKQWVATAAHCLDTDANVDGKPLGLNPRTITAALRTTDGEKQPNVQVFVGNAILHPLWDGNLDNGYDIALIKLPKSAKVEPIRMAAEGAKFKTGEGLVGLGFGEVPEDKKQSRRLRWGKLSYQDNDRCNREDIWNNTITPAMMCAGAQLDDNAQLCKGDSGGPLIQAHAPGGNLEEGDPAVDLLVGLVSFGDFMACDPERSQKDSRPMVFTRLSEVRDWIDATLEGRELQIKPAEPSRALVPRTEEPEVEEPPARGPPVAPVRSERSGRSERSERSARSVSRSTQVCGSESQADREFYWTRSAMGFLFSPDWPKSCGDLDKLDLIQCSEDINTKKGCCFGQCLAILDKMSPECWQDFAEEMCLNGLTEEVKLMNGLGRRCLPELGPFACEKCETSSEFEVNAAVEAELGHLQFLEVPKACGNLLSLSLLICERDLEVETVPGCCEEKCLNLLDSMSNECWIAINENACHTLITRRLVQLMNALSRRCETVHRPVECKNDKFSTPLSGSSGG